LLNVNLKTPFCRNFQHEQSQYNHKVKLSGKLAWENETFDQLSRLKKLLLNFTLFEDLIQETNEIIVLFLFS
jgi:hypothetical protein